MSQAIGHYLCHKYSIQGCAYTEELAALAAGHGANDVGAKALLPPQGDMQLLVPPAQVRVRIRVTLGFGLPWG